jgi:hypothetical protein
MPYIDIETIKLQSGSLVEKKPYNWFAIELKVLLRLDPTSVKAAIAATAINAAIRAYSICRHAANFFDQSPQE